jgi:EAL domain-containing protein (putative c-di-GMP-specific phosphodiesterase class I)
MEHKVTRHIMNTQPHRQDFTDQPWLGFPVELTATMAALGFCQGQSTADLDSAIGQTTGIPTLHLQPRHALRCGVLCAAEASLRTSAPVADEEDAARLGGWLLETACHEAQDWNAMGLTVMVSVDLPASLLRRDRLVAQTKRALARSGLVPWQLEIQLPEDVATNGDTDVVLSLAALRDLGVGLGLENFGTLPVSLRTLRRLPLTCVKLDPALIRDLVPDRTARVTVKAAIALAHALGTTVLATDVGTVTQRDILADLGCDTGQGKVFGGSVRPDVFHKSLLR